MQWNRGREQGDEGPIEGMAMEEADWELTAAPEIAGGMGEGKYPGRGRRDSQVRLPLRFEDDKLLV